VAKKWDQARRSLGTSWRSTALMFVAFVALLIAGAAFAGETPGGFISTVTGDTTSASIDSGTGATTTSPASTTTAATTTAATTTAATTTAATTTTTTATATFNPTIRSDHADYNPGALVTLTGSGWDPAGDPVHIVVNDTAGVDTWIHDVNVGVSTSGAITDSFNLPTSFVANYTVRATQQTAAGASITASTGFTDSDGQLTQCQNGKDPSLPEDGCDRRNGLGEGEPERSKVRLPRGRFDSVPGGIQRP
jgi:hypothetical protein